MTIVSGAVAGDDLARVASSASTALGRPVAIAIPALGEPVVSPDGAIASDGLAAIREYARAVTAGGPAASPVAVADSVEVRIGEQVVGIVAAATAAAAIGDPAPDPEQHSWLEATATAAAVAALMRDAHGGDSDRSAQALLLALRASPPGDVPALVASAERIGVDLGSGAVAFAARGNRSALPSQGSALLAEVGDGLVLGLVAEGSHDEFARELELRGIDGSFSSPRRDPALLHEALREAELLAELASAPDAALPGQEDTYRLLIGVLLRDPAELERLQGQTIAPIVIYDAEHDTELLATLQTFLVRHGSTTETAEAMQLHRHTVGYRLARIHEVSSLSPYESDGRERLSLGLKAHEIIAADERRPKPG